MTSSSYTEAARRVIVRGGLATGLAGGVLVLLAVAGVSFWGPEVQALRESARQQGQGESVAVLLGVLGGLLLASLPVLVIGPLVLCDRRYGARCPRCRHSVTLGCPQAIVLRSGRCTRCQEVLFAAAGGAN